jgi:hypothetical protein
MILMELADRGSFRDLLDERKAPLSEDQISLITRDVLLGLEMLHSKYQSVHGDIKAANLLFSSSGSVKMSDFGVARRFDAGAVATMTVVGTPYWMAPEVITGPSYSYPADIWSLGITVVEMAEGSAPYLEMQPRRAMIEITKRGFPGWRFPTFHSPDICDFVDRCVRRNPAARPSASELLAHPFIKRGEGIDRKQVMDELLNKAKIERVGSLPAEPKSFMDAARQIREAGDDLESRIKFDAGSRTAVGQLPNQADKIEVAQRTDSVFVVKRCDPRAEVIDDATFAKASRIMSRRIPFVPVQTAADPDEPIENVYTIVKQKPRPALQRVAMPPLFDRDGVISFETAFRHRKATSICALVLVLASVSLLGKEGLFLLLAVALGVHMTLLILRKRTERDAGNDPDED